MFPSVFLSFLLFPLFLLSFPKFFYTFLILSIVLSYLWLKEREREGRREEERNEGTKEEWKERRKGGTKERGERSHNYSVVNQEHGFLKPDVDHHYCHWKQIFTSLKASSFNTSFHYSSPKSLPPPPAHIQGWVELLDVWGHFWEFGSQQKPWSSLLS